MKNDEKNLYAVYREKVIVNENTTVAPTKPVTKPDVAPAPPKTNPNPFAPRPGKRNKETVKPEPKNRFSKLRQILAKYINL